MKYQTGFIGCGNMGGALIQAVAKSDPNGLIAVYDPIEQKALSFAQSFQNVSSVSFEQVLTDSEYIFLGVKPQVLPSVLADIAPILQKRNNEYCIVSMAAGTSIQKIADLSGLNCPIIRIMPNTSVAVGMGVVLYCNNEQAAPFVNGFLTLLSGAGVVDEIDESKIDAASAVSGCGPAFVYLFIEALADGGVECGLPRDKALLYAEATVAGAAKTALSTGKHPGELKDAVCSPGGTTIAGVHALENKGFRAAAMDAVVSAYKKTLELK